MRLKICDLPQLEKPRERLFNYGAEALSMRELLEIILGHGSEHASVDEIAGSLISRFPNWQSLAQAESWELANVRGIGKAKAAQLKASFELGRRFSQEKIQPASGSILNAQDAFNLCRTYLKDKKKEHLMLFCLDVRCRLITSPEIVSVGILDCSVLHPREIFGAAIKKSAANILIAHNHPSGSAEPSDADIEVSRQLVKSAAILAIPLVDHIVVGQSDYISIRQKYPEVFKPDLQPHLSTETVAQAGN